MYIYIYIYYTYIYVYIYTHRVNLILSGRIRNVKFHRTIYIYVYIYRNRYGLQPTALANRVFPVPGGPTNMKEIRVKGALCAPTRFDSRDSNHPNDEIWLKTHSCAWAKWIYPKRLLSSCRAPLTLILSPSGKIRKLEPNRTIHMSMYIHIETEGVVCGQPLWPIGSSPSPVVLETKRIGSILILIRSESPIGIQHNHIYTFIYM